MPCFVFSLTCLSENFTHEPSEPHGADGSLFCEETGTRRFLASAVFTIPQKEPPSDRQSRKTLHMARLNNGWRAPNKTCQRHLVQRTCVMLVGRSILMVSFPMAAAVQAAQASTILFGNLGYGAGVASYAGLLADGPLAASFLPSPDRPQALSEVKVGFNTGGGTDNAGAFVRTLNSDFGGAPGAAILTLGTVYDAPLAVIGVLNFWG